MTADELLALIAGGETLDVEFKGEEKQPMGDNELVEAGLLEGHGERKGRAYHLSVATYRRLGDKVGYIRQRGFEPLQQEQMILQYVEKHGRITRKEAADLCRLAPSQARNLLMRMKNGNRLVLQGARRGAFYVLPPK